MSLRVSSRREMLANVENQAQVLLRQKGTGFHFYTTIQCKPKYLQLIKARQGSNISVPVSSREWHRSSAQEIGAFGVHLTHCTKQYIHLVICTHICLGPLYIWQPESYLFSGLTYPDKWEKLSFTTQRTYPGRRRRIYSRKPKAFSNPR